jgi:tetratricopeptide (TPR) repeat protein
MNQALRWLSRLMPVAPEDDARIAEWMRAAYREHEAGNLAAAAQGYERILRHRPRDADALFLLGEIEHRRGRLERAIDLVGQAVNANPVLPAFHRELGAVLQAAGRRAEAAAAWGKAIELEPGHLATRVDLAALLIALGLHEAAEQHCRSALEIDPQAVAAHVNLGSALEGLGRPAEAEPCYLRALEIDPQCAQAHCNLGTARLKLGRIEEARASVERALALDPLLHAAHLNLGNVRLEQKQLEPALASFREALRLRPGAAITLCNIGYVLERLSDLEGAERCYRQALESDPDWIQAHVNLSGLLLARESFAEGWREMEWRLRLPESQAVHQRFAIPRWDGGSLAGRSLLVYGEQGLGDEIMYASCVAEVAARAKHVVLDCDLRLEGLFRRSFPGVTVHGGTQAEAADWVRQLDWVDAKVPSSSLPLHLRRSAADFPQHRGYLHADPAKVERWRARLAALGPGPKLGLSWRGGLQKTGRVWRSLDLEQMVPALRAEGLHLVNLQYGECREELEELERRHGLRVHHWPEAIDDYDETAALVCALDLTLSVCTALVHLAGALGRPVWVMAPLRPDARYGLRGERMRWYPSVRMFRQSALDDWAGVIATVARELPRAEGGPA